MRMIIDLNDDELIVRMTSIRCLDEDLRIFRHKIKNMMMTENTRDLTDVVKNTTLATKTEVEIPIVTDISTTTIVVIVGIAEAYQRCNT